MRLPSWNLLVAFEAVARHGNFSRAATELNVLQPAISRRVGLLEKELGVNLIQRSRPHAKLTSDGQILFRAVTGSLTQVQMAVEQISRTPFDQTLSIGTTIGFANCFLMRRLSEFRNRYPDIPVELISRDMNDGYSLENCDAITVFDHPENLVGVTQAKIFDENMIAVCSPSYLEEFPVEGGNFSGHRLLHLPVGMHGEDWSMFLSSIDQTAPPPDSSQRFTSFMVYLQAAINGEGIAIGWKHLLDDLIDSGQLINVSKHSVRTTRGYHCCITDRGKDKEGSHKFLDWCKNLVKQNH